ncbi:MAG: hypothetical protein KF752_14480 [Pirellulaceae bacterium]|nr:hypothetical protein [Pirellulaceae bacterium]
MSSTSREPLSGVIRQDMKIVGGICLPETDVFQFIDNFNHCYGPLKMKIDLPTGAQRPAGSQILQPIGATRSGNLGRPVQQTAALKSTLPNYD